jgi:Family of unknown function (DUF6281)
MKRTAVAATVALLLAGCAGSTNAREGRAASECTSQVRLDGVIYSGYGYTDQQATRLGTADEADCHDVGPDPKWSVFPENPRQVEVWSFEGYSPHEVVGVRFDDDSFAVFVAESVQPDRASRVFNELSQPD